MQKYEKYARLVLAFSKGIGSRNFLQILQKYGSAYNFVKKNSDLKEVFQEIQQISLNDYIVYGEQYYPFILSQIYDPPIVLFYKGNINLLSNSKCISIVGTRRYSNYGLDITRKFVHDLVDAGYIIISGMALGIDSIAHQAALKFGGKTIAVLGTSLETKFYGKRVNLISSIINNHGLIISETNQFEVHKGSFPRRNRIIAGLSKATIIIEAPKRSGALITANLAFDYDREVYAVPGNINSLKSEGTNLLIQNQKANLILDTKDIADIEGDNVSQIKDSLSRIEKQIYECVTQNINSADDIANFVSLPVKQVINILTSLELKKIVAKEISGNYTLIF